MITLTGDNTKRLSLCLKRAAFPFDKKVQTKTTSTGEQQIKLLYEKVACSSRYWYLICFMAVSHTKFWQPILRLKDIAKI